jgi:hypothetical protein
MTCLSAVCTTSYRASPTISLGAMMHYLVRILLKPFPFLLGLFFIIFFIGNCFSFMNDQNSSHRGFVNGLSLGK